MGKNFYKMFFRVIVSTFLIVALFQKVSFRDTLSLFMLYSPWVLFSVLILYLFAIFLSAVRWSVLLPEFPLGKIIRFTFVGQFYALVLPGQITGEFAKAYRFTSDSKFKGGKITSSILIDKVIGLIGVMVLTIVGLLLSDFSDRFYYLTVVSMVSLVLLAGLVVFFRVSFYEKFQTMLQKGGEMVHFLKPISVFVHEIFESCKEYSKNKEILFKNFTLSIIFQFFAISITYFLALNLGVEINITEWFWIFGLVSIAIVLPITVAGLGLREGMFAFFLLQFNVAPEIAVTLSLTVLLLQIIGALAGGVLEVFAFVPMMRKHIYK